MSQVTHPKHYNSGKIEVIEFLEDQKFCFHTANAVKYISRAGKKNADKEIEDLEKAVWYLRRKIENLTAVKEGRKSVRPNAMKPYPFVDVCSSCSLVPKYWYVKNEKMVCQKCFNLSQVKGS